MKISPIIGVEELKELVKSEAIVLIDSRFPNGRNQYVENHLLGAQFVDVDKDLADIQPNFKDGGRHPMPKVEDFVQVLNRLGISKNSYVVVYDNASGAFAARMWWMLRSVGHEKVQVLDGGYDVAVSHGFSIESGEGMIPSPTQYVAHQWNWPRVSMNDVQQISTKKGSVLVDVREDFRYRGESEPIDLVAGHIPGAINIPFRTHLDENGLFVSPDELLKKYAELFRNHEEVVFYCGSGVTACHGILAAHVAGLPIATLYTGSWSEWSRNDQPIGRV